MVKKRKPAHTYMKGRRDPVYKQRIIPNKKKIDEDKRKKVVEENSN